jgi:hypothetical protein
MSEITGGDIAAVADELSGSSASAHDASPASDPGSESESTPAATATIAPSSDAPPEPSTDPASAGPIPFDRHKSALENARVKAREEALTEWRQQHGWAEQVDRTQLESWSQTAAQMSSDPVGFLQKFAAELQNHPVYGPQLKSHAARTLGQRQAAQVDDVEPQADLQTEDGTPVYSAKQLAAREAWRERQWEKKFSERLAPLQETHAEMQEARQRELIENASSNFAKRELDAVRALPHYDQYKAEIKAKFAAMPPPEHPAGYSAQLYRAYVETVVPKLSQSERSKVLAEMQTKGAASTASPTRPSASAPMRDADRPISDLIAEEMARHVGA